MIEAGAARAYELDTQVAATARAQTAAGFRSSHGGSGPESVNNMQVGSLGHGAAAASKRHYSLRPCTHLDGTVATAAMA